MIKMGKLVYLLGYVKRLQKKPSIIVILLMGILGIVAASVVLFYLFAPLKANEVILRIRPGENTRIIARKLRQAGVIRSTTGFYLLARLTKSDHHLRAGRYVFGGNISLWQSIKQIKRGSSLYLHLTIPEGFSLYQTCKQMERSGIASYDTLLSIATNATVVERLTGFHVTSLEGFLYPETYAFDIDLSPEAIFSQMTRLFFKQLDKAGIVIDSKQDFYHKLILASIVEQEAVAEIEKPLIAGVYLSRLKKGMKLESCPTIDYVLERQGIHRKRLLYSDLQIESEYNTYKIAGLPPAPICNPSLSAIKAVLNPEMTDFLYFFADFEGHNVFSKTYSEHLRKQKQFMKE